MAPGADRRNVLTMILREAGLLPAIGLAGDRARRRVGSRG
jgi:hypothetical protein